MGIKDRVYLYDSTLRDGGQTSTINFSSEDKKIIASKIDEIGIDYIEGGWPGANIVDDQFFANLPKFYNSKLSAFGMTGKKSMDLDKLIKSEAKSVCIVGKSWDFHLKYALNISEEENFQIISDSILYIVKNGKEAIFDAEHFFDGYKSNPKFSLNCLKSAFDAGARWIVLCDTNGGSLPNEIYDITLKVKNTIPGENLGIHCHNDSGLAVANSISAIQAGVRQVQGTINGLGERCGNADLITLIPNLMLKMGFDVGFDDKKLKKLCQLSYFLDDLLNKPRNNFSPFVGKFAFAHKGGLHVSAINKNPKSYEHISPDQVGNKRRIMISDQAGKSNIISKITEMGLDIDKIDSKIISDLVQKVKILESKGYAYDNAEASFEILVRKSLGLSSIYFQLLSFKVSDELIDYKNNQIISKAEIKIKVGDEIKLSKSDGIGPINAIDGALRSILSNKYPILKKISLSDYKVQIIDSHDGTKSKTRVEIRSKDENGKEWTTIGVSRNIVDASLKALEDGINFKLMNQT